MALQTGRVRNSEMQLLAGATVRVGGASTTTPSAYGPGEEGTYALLVWGSKPAHTILSAPGFWSLVDQEWIPLGTVVRRPGMLLVDDGTAAWVGSRIPDADPTKGKVVVQVNGDPSCFSANDVTLAMSPAGDARVVYFAADNVPDPSLDHAEFRMGNGPQIQALFVNVEPNVRFQITARSSSCAQVPFPIAFQDVMLTGWQYAEGGRSLSFYRVFLTPTP